jgi:hypothetical protein
MIQTDDREPSGSGLIKTPADPPVVSIEARDMDDEETWMELTGFDIPFFNLATIIHMDGRADVPVIEMVLNVLEDTPAYRVSLNRQTLVHLLKIARKAGWEIGKEEE